MFDLSLRKFYKGCIGRTSSITGLAPDKLNRILRFLIVGGGLNVILLLAVILMERSGLGYDLALLVTNVFGLCFNYVLNRTFVFKSDEKVGRTAFLYAATYASVYLLQLALYRGIFALGLFHDYVSITLTVGVSAIYAYVMLEKVVFPDRNSVVPDVCAHKDV